MSDPHIVFIPIGANELRRVKRFTHPVLGRVDGYANLAEYEHDVGSVEPDVDDDPPEEVK